MSRKAFRLVLPAAGEQIADHRRADVLAPDTPLVDADEPQPPFFGQLPAIGPVVAKTVVIPHYKRLRADLSDQVTIQKLGSGKGAE